MPPHNRPPISTLGCKWVSIPLPKPKSCRFWPVTASEAQTTVFRLIRCILGGIWLFFLVFPDLGRLSSALGGGIGFHAREKCLGAPTQPHCITHRFSYTHALPPTRCLHTFFLIGLHRRGFLPDPEVGLSNLCVTSFLRSFCLPKSTQLQKKIALQCLGEN